MENFLICMSCMKKFNTTNHIPLILQCGHTFCYSCVTSLIAVQKQNILTQPQLTYLQCPLDKSIGSNYLNINQIPVNKLLIDMLDFNGASLSELSISETNSNNNNNNNNIKDLSYIESVYVKLTEQKTTFDNYYNLFYSSILDLTKQKDVLVTFICEVFDGMIHKIQSEKDKTINKLCNYMSSKINEINEINKIVERNRNIIDINIKKINGLKNQQVKQITLSDQLLLLNEMNLSILDNKNELSKMNELLWQITSNKIVPRIYIKDSTLNQFESLMNCIQVTYHEGIREQFFDANNNNNSNNNDSNNSENVISLSSLNFDFSLLNICPSFIWFKPNSNCIYQLNYIINENPNYTWKQLPNKQNIIFSEMFGVCQISEIMFFITGGIENFQSSKKSYLYTLNENVIEKENMFYPRRTHGTCLLREFVFVCGGLNSYNESISHCEKFCLKSNKWLPIADLPTRKAHLSLCAVNDEKIFNFGGDTNQSLTNTIDMYEYAKDIWIQLSICMNTFIECCVVVQVNKKELLVCGGYCGDSGGSNQVVKFNVDSFDIEIQEKKMKVSGWSVYYGKYHMGKVHMFLGEDNNEMPYYYIYDYK